MQLIHYFNPKTIQLTKYHDAITPNNIDTTEIILDFKLESLPENNNNAQAKTAVGAHIVIISTSPMNEAPLSVPDVLL